MNAEELQQNNLHLQGQVNQLQQQLQQQQLQQHQPQGQPAWERHLQQDLQLKLLRKEEDKVPKCDGTEPDKVRAWIKDVELARVPQDQLNELITDTCVGAFRREVERFIEQHNQQRQNVPWEEIRTHLLQAFVSTDNTELVKRKLEKLNQDSFETIISYNRRFRETAEEAYPAGGRNEDQERALIKAYARGLAKDAGARKLVSQGWPINLAAAMDRMTTQATATEIYDHLGRREVPMEVGAVGSSTPDRRMEQIQSTLAKLETQMRDIRNASRSVKCFSCGKAGHISRDCRSREYRRPQSMSASRPTGSKPFTQGHHGQSKN